MIKDDLAVFSGKEDVRITGEVVACLGGYKFKVQDAAGLFYLVESDLQWFVGDTVAVLAGRIMGRALPMGPIKVVNL